MSQTIITGKYSIGTDDHNLTPVQRQALSFMFDKIDELETQNANYKEQITALVKEKHQAICHRCEKYENLLDAIDHYMEDDPEFMENLSNDRERIKNER